MRNSDSHGEPGGRGATTNSVLISGKLTLYEPASSCSARGTIGATHAYFLRTAAPRLARAPWRSYTAVVNWATGQLGRDTIDSPATFVQSARTLLPTPVELLYLRVERRRRRTRAITLAETVRRDTGLTRYTPSRACDLRHASRYDENYSTHPFERHNNCTPSTERVRPSNILVFDCLVQMPHGRPDNGEACAGARAWPPRSAGGDR
ncbi:hypothetical protein EVAR_64574_1 [Eumeta japonica]|uniref:Uncharacterized protein n=1 Tax=Eumeta variegata TaxID=151549 RepID=A0A4C1ZEL1_EUMVA|nr:hypothetical protein EVAR_64574_1 [Eumeta japonica]